MIKITTIMLMYANLYIFLKCVTSSNPLNMAMKLATLSVSMMSMIYLENGTTWFTLTFLLVFLGGMIIMFLILSSVSPNEKFMKNKINSYMILTFMITPMVYFKKSTEGARELTTSKWFLSYENMNLMFIIMMVCYLTVFNELLKKKKSTMRSIE